MRPPSPTSFPKKEALLVFDVLLCVFVRLFCARFSDWPLCFSVRCSATPSPSQGRKSGHLMVSSTSSGVQKHSLSEGKLETKSSRESREGRTINPIRIESQILPDQLLKPSKFKARKQHTSCCREAAGCTSAYAARPQPHSEMFFCTA